VAELVLSLPIRAAWVQVDGVRAVGDGGAFEELVRCAERYRHEAGAAGITSPGGVEGVGVARSLFHELSIDPTRHRPCSEALLNRALKGKSQPRVCDLVDVGNWCALDFLLPLGVYDRDAVGGAIELRRGRPGETYMALNGREITLDGRYVLADERGPFGSPITDSRRAAVHDGTTRCLVILYAPRSYPEPELEAAARRLAERVVAHCGGELSALAVVSGGSTGA
jgi:DNA/RNA-binding domain of Phe-tRNA-synthetase-like protein